jgi:hypothetical protein
MPAIQSKNGGTTREVGEMMQRFRNEVEHNPLLPQSGRTSETGSIGLRARHVVRVLSGPPRILPIAERTEGMRIAPELAGRLFRQQSLRRDVLGERTIFATASLARENPFPQAFGNLKRPEVKIAKAGRASRAGVYQQCTDRHLQSQRGAVRTLLLVFQKPILPSQTMQSHIRLSSECVPFYMKQK